MDARSALFRIAVIAALLAPAGPACGQTTRSASSPERPAPHPAPRRTMSETPRVRPPLLREGSRIVQVTGVVRRDETDGTWTFVIDDGRAGPSYELTIMPCAFLGEMEQMIAIAANDHLVFEVTGQVYVYREQNYLMPTHPPLLIRHELSAPETTAPTPMDEVGGDATENIIRDLERSVGPVPRRAAPDRRAPFAATGDDGTGGGPSLEGTILVERRGIVRRTASGAYVLLFDADAEGNADPPMRLLPCLLLQSLEGHARDYGERATVLVSGHVYTYRGLNYLRPTLFRIPRDRTRLQP